MSLAVDSQESNCCPSILCSECPGSCLDLRLRSLCLLLPLQILHLASHLKDHEPFSFEVCGSYNDTPNGLDNHEAIHYLMIDFPEDLNDLRHHLPHLFLCCLLDLKTSSCNL